VAIIEQRLVTANDQLGDVYIENKEILPPNITFYSKEIGSQNQMSIVRSPSAIYGFDVYKRKLWKLGEQLAAISDDGFASFMEKNMTENAKFDVATGYDLEYHDVYFTYVEYNDDDTVNVEKSWTLVYNEGLNRFSFFFTGTPYYYARRYNDFYSFGLNTKSNPHPNEPQPISPSLAFKHNLDGSNMLYGRLEESYVEFVINASPNISKVFDYLEIISNEVEPLTIELYTYDKETVKDTMASVRSVDDTKAFQYIKLVQQVDMFTEEKVFRLRDRKFVVQIPTVQKMKEDNFENWEKNGRLRNKYVIVRVTYKTEERLELLSVLTKYRNSIS
jgi:hypothetical protein